jgi:hypothetical protein
MLDEIDGVINKLTEHHADLGAALDLMRRQRAALESCRSHCWVRNPNTNGEP